MAYDSETPPHFCGTSMEMHGALKSRRQFLVATASSLALAGSGALNGCALHKPGKSVLYAPPALGSNKATTLRGVAAGSGLLTGFALNVSEIRGSEAYRQTVRDQCSLAVAENAMKWGPLRPTSDRYFFDDADDLLRFAEENHIRMRGHNLCWHQALPAWFSSAAVPGNARSLLTTHIRTVAGRYAGRIHSWDVVNEAVQVQDGRPDGLRVSPWLTLVGEDYIEIAFRTAREADPSALLTYNEYGIESETDQDAQKRAAVILLLRRLRQRNVPIDAVGIQSHIRAGASHRYGEGLRAFIRECRSLDLEVFLTEMDVDDRDLPMDIGLRDIAVAEAYQAYLNVVVQEPNVRACLTWGVGDNQTWLNHESPRKDGAPQRPLLFDQELHPKRAFDLTLAAFRTRAGKR